LMKPLNSGSNTASRSRFTITTVPPP
jgi:hypothetical protein